MPQCHQYIRININISSSTHHHHHVYQHIYIRTLHLFTSQLSSKSPSSEYIPFSVPLLTIVNQPLSRPSREVEHPLLRTFLSLSLSVYSLSTAELCLSLSPLSPLPITEQHIVAFPLFSPFPLLPSWRRHPCVVDNSLTAFFF